MKHWRQLLFLIPVFVFLALLTVDTYKGVRNPNDRLCRELWQKKQWQQLSALAENLQQLGKADAQTLCIAMLGADQAKNTEAVAAFAAHLKSKNAVNWRIERELMQLDSDSGFRNLLHIHRTSAATLVLLALIALNVRGILRRNIPLSSAICAVIGCLVLLL
jgi:hypothetical protein